VSFLVGPPADELLGFFSGLNRVLADEDCSYRPYDGDGLPGGLVELALDIPTVVLPDIHARPRFVRSVLDYELPELGMTVEEAVRCEEAQLVCVGDYFHGEGRVARRWREALAEFGQEFEPSPAMDAEMAEGLEALRLLGTLKSASPRFTQLLKGNHENVANEEGGGNHPFGKYAYEGAMVASYISLKYGERVLSAIYAFEKSLPLVAVGNRFVISHAEPERPYARERIIGYRRDPEVVYGLTWTADDRSEEGSVDAMLDDLLSTDRREGALWFGGHRPVFNRYRLRGGGSYVQFHNPSRSQVAFLPADRPPDPERDIIEIGEGQDTRDDQSAR